MTNKKKSITTSPLADKQLEKIIDDLIRDFSIIQAQKFVIRFDTLLELIQEYPSMFPVARRNEKIRRGLAHKTVSFYYRVNKNSIRILYFKYNKSKP